MTWLDQPQPTKHQKAPRFCKLRVVSLNVILDTCQTTLNLQMPYAITSMRETIAPRYKRLYLLPSFHRAHHKNQAQEQLKELNHHHYWEIIYIWHGTTDSFSTSVSLDYSVACTRVVIISRLHNEGIHITEHFQCHYYI